MLNIKGRVLSAGGARSLSKDTWRTLRILYIHMHSNDVTSPGWQYYLRLFIYQVINACRWHDRCIRCAVVQTITLYPRMARLCRSISRRNVPWSSSSACKKSMIWREIVRVACVCTPQECTRGGKIADVRGLILRRSHLCGQAFRAIGWAHTREWLGCFIINIIVVNKCCLGYHAFVLCRCTQQCVFEYAARSCDITDMRHSSILWYFNQSLQGLGLGSVVKNNYI